MNPQLSPSSQRPMDPSQMPQPLRPLIPVVQRWGAVGSDSERYELADAAESDERCMAELDQFAASWTAEMHEAYEAWFDQMSIVDSYERAKFYFTILLLGELDIEIKCPSPRQDAIQQTVRQLQKMKGIGAAAGRMWAARGLGERGAEAKAALPALHRATTDPKPQVRAWAHAAIALIDGKEPEHRSAIREILEQDFASESASEEERRQLQLDRSFAENALKELDRPPQERALNRICGAAITNEVDVIRLLARTVDVNRPDHNNQTAIHYAVGNTHLEAVRALLEAGANPNQRVSFDDVKNGTVLHDAARRKKAEAIIALLLKHGADPNLTDDGGWTALDVARDYRRKENAKLLKEAMQGKP